MRSIRYGLLVCAGLLALVPWSGAVEQSSGWPQWRGPHLNGSNMAARNLPVRWSQTENVRWRASLPSWSAATPIVWGDAVFVTSAEEGFGEAGPFYQRHKPGEEQSGRPAGQRSKAKRDKILLLALDRATGAVRWTREIGDGNRVYRKHNLASPSPVTDGRFVWAMTGGGDLRCFDFKGRQIWERNIQADYGAFGLNHGYASSPLLAGSRIYIQVLHGMKTDEPSYVLAVDKATGRTLWKTDRRTDAVFESPDSYSTPIVVKTGGRNQLVVLGGDYVTGHDLNSGKELWRMGGLNPKRERFYRTIASAFAIGDVIYASSARGKPFLAFRAGGAGGMTRTELLWKNDLGSDVPTPATDGKRIFVVSDRGVVTALDPATGAVTGRRQRIEPGIYSASPLVADGKLYAVNEDGVVTVLSADDQLDVLGVNRLEGHTLASPAAAGDQIFIRTAESLYCISKR